MTSMAWRTNMVCPGGPPVPDLEDQHVLAEVVPLLEEDAQRGGGEGGRHGLELQPQGLLLGRHHLAALQLDKGSWGG